MTEKAQKVCIKSIQVVSNKIGSRMLKNFVSSSQNLCFKVAKNLLTVEFNVTVLDIEIKRNEFRNRPGSRMAVRTACHSCW